MELFKEFITRLERSQVEHLRILESLFSSTGFKVSHHYTIGDPYLFIYNPKKHPSFAGVRLYFAEDILAYRVQNLPTSEPYGDAYPLDVEGMFLDLLGDHHKPSSAARALVIEAATQLKRFFIQSEKAASELGVWEPGEKIVDKVSPVDYGNLIYLPRA